MPKMPAGCPSQQEICVELEQYIQPCSCGGTFKKGSFPRCPQCNQPLSPEAAAVYIEKNAADTRGGWRWQRNWSETYCIIIEEKLVQDNFRRA
jgi:hypothetical protein